MHLDPGDWLELAEALSPGVKTKVPHKGCTSSSAMIIEHGAEGFSAYCFKCGAKGWKPHGPTSMRQYLERKDAIKARHEAERLRGIDLPEDFSQNMPDVGALWLAKNGFSYLTCIDTHGMGWSEKLQRVVIPLHNIKREYIGFTARAMYKNQGPKYLERIRDKQYPFLACHNTGRGGLLILCEDYLSGLRLSMHADVLPLMGTSIDPSAFAILRRYSAALCWLDSDLAGRKGAAGIRRKYSHAIKITDTCTEQDPKHLTYQEIRRHLDELPFRFS